MFPSEAIVVNGRKQYLHNLSKIQEQLSTEKLAYLMLMESAEEAMETIAAILDAEYAETGNVHQGLDWLYSTLNSNI